MKNENLISDFPREVTLSNMLKTIDKKAKVSNCTIIKKKVMMMIIITKKKGDDYPQLLTSIIIYIYPSKMLLFDPRMPAKESTSILFWVFTFHERIRLLHYRV